MPSRVIWTTAMDAALRALRAEGFAWAAIARTLGVNPPTARKRGREIGLRSDLHLSSGTLTGVKIVCGVKPLPKRFTQASSARRLGKRWVRSEG